MTIGVGMTMIAPQMIPTTMNMVTAVSIPMTIGTGMTMTAQMMFLRNIGDCFEFTTSAVHGEEDNGQCI